MRVTGGSGSVSAPASDRTLEERLYAAHDQFALLVDVFALQGLAPDDARGGGSRRRGAAPSGGSAGRPTRTCARRSTACRASY